MSHLFTPLSNGLPVVVRASFRVHSAMETGLQICQQSDEKSKKLLKTSKKNRLPMGERVTGCGTAHWGNRGCKFANKHTHKEL
ncbi:hypothetical protein [Candidatus Sororendozoicomonas aggregata]|uniref:hypothetical protein n=1 Tax=Candidatus Sororendozoicomonas aggregata TaxID=3073239 RepID=UPI002ED07B32